MDIVWNQTICRDTHWRKHDLVSEPFIYSKNELFDINNQLKLKLWESILFFSYKFNLLLASTSIFQHWFYWFPKPINQYDKLYCKLREYLNFISSSLNWMFFFFYAKFIFFFFSSEFFLFILIWNAWKSKFNIYSVCGYVFHQWPNAANKEQICVVHSMLQ